MKVKKKFIDFCQNTTSHYDQGEDIVFAKKIYMGKIPSFMKEIYVYPCTLSTEHSRFLYEEMENIEKITDIFNIKNFPYLSSISNMCFPIMKNKKEITFVDRKKFQSWYKTCKNKTFVMKYFRKKIRKIFFN